MSLFTTKRSYSIPLAAGVDEALATARTALSTLDWPAEEVEPGTLVATEDFARLHCHCQPISVRIELAPGFGEEVMMLIRTSVPGRGPIASRHLDTQSGVLIRRILASAARH